MYRKKFILCKVSIIAGKMAHAMLVLTSASHNDVSRDPDLDSYKKCMIKAISDKNKQPFESGIHNLTEIFDGIGDNFRC
jgi:hypothetical protein